MTDKAGILIFFPVQSHVFKFINKKCGDKLVASRQDFFGSVVLDLLNKRSSVMPGVTYEHSYPVEVSLHYMLEAGVFISGPVIRKFNHRVDKMFREEMRTYVSISNTTNEIKKDEALRQFMNHYNITEDDIKFETLKKDLIRNI